MNKINLGKVVAFVPGVNPTRVKKRWGDPKIEYYDQDSFTLDCECLEINRNVRTENKIDSILMAGDIIINNSIQFAVRVGTLNAGKVLSLNFTRVKFINGILDENYFLYMFNKFTDVQRQKEQARMGLSIQRISIKSLNEMVIPLPDIEKQREIGKIYVESLHLQLKLKRKAYLLNQLTTQVLEKSMKGN